MLEVLIIFMVYSVLGWIWETSYVSIKQRKFVNRGFLYGPIIPIYGTVCVTIMISMKLIEPLLPENNFMMVIIAIIYIALVASCWEYIVSYLLEILFKTRWWDYSNRKFNLHGRIALQCSIFWGICGFIFWDFINKPLIESIISFRYIEEVLYIFYTLFIVDTIVTISQLITLTQMMRKLDVILDELSDRVHYSIDIVNEEVKQKKEQILKAADKGILMLIHQKNAKLSSRQKLLIHKFNSLLERSRNVSRFYKKYPKAHSIKFKKIAKAIKYKRNNEE